jgi:hypothetical protein
MKHASFQADAPVVPQHCQKLVLLAAAAITMATARALDSATTEDPRMVKATYHFNLKRGKGLLVCEAYLERLTNTRFTSPPFCGIPENDAIQGFTKLNRTPLTDDEVERLFPKIVGFTIEGKKLTNVSKEEISLVRGTFGDVWSAWRYVPEVNVDNTGKPYNVIIWQGPDAATFDYHCGDVGHVGPTQELVIERPQQLAFVLTDNNQNIDEEKTWELFGDRSRQVYVDRGETHVFPGFEPIADTIDLFKFRGLYYIAGFNYRTFGSYEGIPEDPSLRGALSVFLRKDGQTRQVCEFNMTGTLLDTR